MAVDMDQQQSFKHFCRICKKGFGCGRALGGHMRAHGIGDDAGHVDDDDPAANWEDKLGGNGQAGNKRMYALRTNPNRFKSCRSCENCGKEFSSWRSFFEHGKCSSDDGESLVSSPGREEGDDGRMGCSSGWSKGKRTRRVTVAGSSNSGSPPSSEEEDLANCLVMLSTARVAPLVAETEESCASADKAEEEEERRQRNFYSIAAAPDEDKAKGVKRGLFECKACKKVFNSHQALGGHRASHKKVKGCFAAKLDDLLDEGIVVEEEAITYDDFSINPPKILPLSLDHHDLSIPPKKKSRVHECSICHRIFPTGQALGGHKRCHWITSNSPESCSIAKFQHRPSLAKTEPLDLNLPAPLEDPSGLKQGNLSPLQLQLPAAIYLQQWIGMHSKIDKSNETNKSNYNSSSSNIASSSLHLDEEGDGKIKLAKLSDLKDMNMGGYSSPWLQVGIGSASNGVHDS